MVRRARALVAVGAIVVLALAAATAWALRDRSLRDDERPVLVGSRFVSVKTGRVIGIVSSELATAFARPERGRDGVFRLGPLRVDANARTSTSADATGVEPGPEPTGDSRMARPPYVAQTADRVYQATATRLTAVDRAMGRRLWKKEGEYDRLAASGGAVYAFAYGAVVALDAVTGELVFRVPLVPGADPEPLAVEHDLLVVRARWPEDGFTRFYDRHGAVRFEIPYVASFVEGTKEGWLVASPRGLALYSSAGTSRWLNPDVRGGFRGGVEVIAVATDGLIALDWDGTVNDGVRVVSLSNATGKTLWVHDCEGVKNDRYGPHAAEHVAYGEARGDELVVVSEGLDASFVEVLDLETGKSRRRFTW